MKRAYIESRYSKKYKISLDELRILRERVLDLAVRVRRACGEKLASFCGPGLVGELPEAPAAADIGELPEAPPVDDARAFDAWREALTTLSFDRGKEAGLTEGQKQGFDRGKEAGEQEGFGRGKDAGLVEGQIRAVLTILATRGIAVDAGARATIEACTEPAVLTGWIARAMAVDAAAQLFAPEPEASPRT